ncbi:hypothetical protein K435DRAFT_872971 [Dendrothele bispora CBS 962.96]|uniref:RNA polymerase II holoenzyme cyclin-like subunit n=1 Tax=Dendrothele bispora (strain CBS 962.96) TaxID=1314807 RepID=A0A4S8L0A7_DENBC|nr:hypothetical protein K435DRAFT_872971 [Dendrothele bispora CBS 962.96]
MPFGFKLRQTCGHSPFSTIQITKTSDVKTGFWRRPCIRWELGALGLFDIYFANSKKLNLRQRVIPTPTVFFRRFYLRNLYIEMDPFLVIAAFCYVTAKAKELPPIHIKTVVQEAGRVGGRETLLDHLVDYADAESSFIVS